MGERPKVESVFTLGALIAALAVRTFQGTAGSHDKYFFNLGRTASATSRVRYADVLRIADANGDYELDNMLFVDDDIIRALRD